jgi:leucyl aminopeptidase
VDVKAVSMEDRNLRRSKQNTMAASSSSSSSKMDQSFPTWRFDKPCTSMQWSELIDVEIALVSSDDNAGTLDDYACDLMILGVSSSGIGSGEEEEKEKRPVLEDAAANYDSALQGALSEILEETSFKAKLGDTTPVLRGFEANKPKRYVSLGLGDTESASEVDKNKSGFSIGKAVAAICIAEKKVKYARVCLPKNFKWSETILKNFSTMFYQEMHIDNRYRTGDNLKKVDLKQLNLVIGDIPTEQQREAIRQGRMLAKGVVLTKDIINAPHCILNSESLADTARRVAETSPNLSCQILGLEECEERGMGAFLGVARGSETQPQFIHLTYKPTDSQVKTKVGIVGKGVCFDTGMLLQLTNNVQISFFFAKFLFVNFRHVQVGITLKCK